VVRRASALSGNVLFLALSTGIVLITAVDVSYPLWYGGHCFGPRYFTEVQGPILILLGAALEVGGRRLGVAAICLTLIVPYSIFIQSMGAFNTTTIVWNAVPISVDQQPSRLWDWNDNPIFRGIRGTLK
jgi:hypothetical protein